MTSDQLLELLEQLGADIRIDGHDLVVRPRRAGLPGELREAIREHKASLVAAVVARRSSGPASCPPLVPRVLAPTPATDERLSVAPQADSILGADWRPTCDRLLGGWFGTLKKSKGRRRHPGTGNRNAAAITNPIRITMSPAVTAIFEEWERRFPNRKSPLSSPTRRGSRASNAKDGSPAERAELNWRPIWLIPDDARPIIESFFVRWATGDGSRELPADVGAWPAEYQTALAALAARRGHGDHRHRAAEETIRRFVRAHDPKDLRDDARRHCGPDAVDASDPGLADLLQADDCLQERSLGPDRLPRRVSDWPEPWRSEYAKRVACMVEESGFTLEEANAKIEMFIRGWAREEAGRE